MLCVGKRKKYNEKKREPGTHETHTKHTRDQKPQQSSANETLQPFRQESKKKSKRELNNNNATKYNMIVNRSMKLKQ